MEAVDPAGFHVYLKKLVNVKGEKHALPLSPSGLQEKEKLTLYSSTVSDPLTITAFIDPSNGTSHILHSSFIPDAYFLSDAAGIYRVVFEDLRQFWPNGQ
jgi:hypothetical protein